MTANEQRNKLRAILSGPDCLSPATVYDPLSSRVAESVGYQIGVLTGSAAARATLAAPDLSLLTLTELADHARRVTRASALSLIVDADHGYGNALNVRRTIEELEHAGVSAVSIEDTALPRRFSQREGTYEIITVEEMLGKLRAAIDARRDPALVIAARTSALRVEDEARMLARLKAYAAAGVDAMFIVGLRTLEQIEAIHAAVDLPIIVAPVAASLSRDELAARGARILLQGHQPQAAAVKALRDAYAHLFRGGAPANLGSKTASSQEMERLVNHERYREWQRKYLA